MRITANIKYWVAETVLLFLGVVFHYFLPICSLKVDDTGVYFSENQDYVFLFYLWVFYAAYSLFPYLMHGSKKEPSRLEKLMNAKKIHQSFEEARQIVLVFCVKFFFIPLMYLGVLFYGRESYLYIIHFNFDVVMGKTVAEIFSAVIYPFVVYFAMFLALLVYLVGYLVESKKRGTSIISVEKSWFAWIVTIICYVPFYPFLFYIFPLASEDFAFYKSQEITFVVRLLLSFLLVLKTITIFNLGLRSSNLTYRGLVTTGIYGWIRHPHYAFKLMLWWIGLIPTAYHFPWFIGPMVFWTMIYYLRAITEEEHLMRVDPAYAEYKKKVKYLFIPKVV